MNVEAISAKILSFFNNKELRGSAYVTIASLISGFFAYLLQIYLGRKMQVADYATFNALLALFTMVTVLNTGISTSTIKVVSELFGQKNSTMLAKLFKGLLSIFSGVGLFTALLIVIFSSAISKMLNFEEVNFLFLFAFYIFANYTTLVPRIYLQGLLKFGILSTVLISQSFLRTAILSILAYFGKSVGSLFLSMGLIQILMLVIIAFVLKGYLLENSEESALPYYKKILNFSAPVFLVYFGMMFFFNIDILMVKGFFDPEIAGLYVGAAIMGKIILFGTGSIAIVMFPQISSRKAQGQDYKKLFKMFTLFQLALVGFALAFFILFPKFITLTLFGMRYAGSIAILPLYAIFISLYVLVNYYSTYYLALGRTKLSLVLIPFALAQIILLFLFHATLYQVLYINIAVTGVLLLLLVAYSFLVDS